MGDTHFTWGGGQTSYVGGCCGCDYDDVDVEKDMDVNEAKFLVSEANILECEASIISAGVGNFRGL